MDGAMRVLWTQKTHDKLKNAAGRDGNKSVSISGEWSMKLNHAG